MIMLKEDHEEYLKCLSDAKYFLNTYCTIKFKKEMLTREELKGSEFEEIANVFVKYFVEDYQKEYYCANIRMIERVTHEDGEVVFVLSFNGNRYDVTKSSIDLEQVIPLLRKEKLEKLKNVST